MEKHGVSSSRPRANSSRPSWSRYSRSSWLGPRLRDNPQGQGHLSRRETRGQGSLQDPHAEAAGGRSLPAEARIPQGPLWQGPRGKIDLEALREMSDEEIITDPGRGQGDRSLDGPDAPDIHSRQDRRPPGRRPRDKEGRAAALLASRRCRRRPRSRSSPRTGTPTGSVASLYLWRHKDAK